MKLVLGAALMAALFGTANADDGSLTRRRLRVAQAANACMANCASQNAACKRVCPTTFSDPCVSACDNQFQTCTQSCPK